MCIRDSIKSAEFAANKIYKGLVKSNNFEITFPKELTLIMKIFKILPYKIYFYLLSKSTGMQKR